MQKPCEAPNCGAVFEAKRAAGRFCSAKCRQRNARAPKTRPASVPGAAKAAPGPAGEVVALPPKTSGVYAAAERELAAVDRVETALGQAVLVLANRMDHPHAETGSSLASLERSFRAALAAATENAGGDEDELDGFRHEAFTVISGGRV